MRILLDHNAPKGLRTILTNHEVRTAYEMGWAELTNGRLLDNAEQVGFDAVITGDQNVRYQQRLAGRRLALVVLSETSWPTLRAHRKLIIDAIEGVREGVYMTVNLPRRRRRRRRSGRDQDPVVQ
jgi:hypothetical protein